MTGYGDDDIHRLIDHFRKALDDANVDAELCELEWTKLKSHLFSRYNMLYKLKKKGLKLAVMYHTRKTSKHISNNTLENIRSKNCLHHT